MTGRLECVYSCVLLGVVGWVTAGLSDEAMGDKHERHLSARVVVLPVHYACMRYMAELVQWVIPAYSIPMRVPWWPSLGTHAGRSGGEPQAWSSDQHTPLQWGDIRFDKGWWAAL
jgi:hypothetical protein